MGIPRYVKGLMPFSGIFLATVFLLLNSVQMRGSSSTVTVYFIDFEAETYIAVTPATIASEAHEKWTISSNRDRGHLLAILNGGPKGIFDENRVRALVIVDQTKYFIDTNGVVRREGSKGTTVDKSAFYKFRDSLPANERHVLTKEIGDRKSK